MTSPVHAKRVSVFDECLDSLDDLLKVCERASAGTVINLQGCVLKSKGVLGQPAIAVACASSAANELFSEDNVSLSAASTPTGFSDAIFTGSMLSGMLDSGEAPSVIAEGDDSGASITYARPLGTPPWGTAIDPSDGCPPLPPKDLSKLLESERDACRDAPADSITLPALVRSSRSSTNGRTSMSSELALRTSCEFAIRTAEECLKPNSGVKVSSAIELRAPGVTIANGTIELPLGHMLIVASDMELRNVTVRGEGPRGAPEQFLPLVYVVGASARFEKVTIAPNVAGYGLGVGRGAQVSLQECESSGHTAAGVVMRGADARLIAEKCNFDRNGQDGLTVSHSAQATLSDCTFQGNELLGAACSGHGSVLTLRGCRVVGNEHALSACNGAKLDLADCVLKDNKCGLVALDEATTIDVRQTNIESNGHGIVVRAGAKVSGSGVTVKNGSVGASVGDRGTEFSLTQSNFSLCSDNGIIVQSGADAMLESCSVADVAKHGITVQHYCSRAQLNDVKVSGCGIAGVMLYRMSTTMLTSCQLVNNKVSGLQIADHFTCVTATNCDLSENGTIGVFVNKGAQVKLVGCSLRKNGSSGCEARDRRVLVTMDACQVLDNLRVGVYCHSAATVTLGGTVVQNNGSTGLLSGGRAGIDIGGGLILYRSDCTVDGGTVLRNGGRVLLEKVADAADSADECSLDSNVLSCTKQLAAASLATPSVS